MKIQFLVPLAATALLAAAPAVAQISPTDTLAAHNAERQNYPGVGPLQWSTDLAQYAQAWAEYIAARDLAEHRQYTTDNPVAPGQYAGENIFWGDGRAYTGPDAVQNWISEKAWYNYSQDMGLGSANPPGPGCNAPANKACGHFTQVIWKDTQTVGCGRAVAVDGTVYIVCNYYPAGNYRGQKPY
jgi:pathogenesis-related protein 1